MPLPVRALSARALAILRTEGVGAVLRHTLTYGAFLSRRVIRYNRSYLYTHEVRNRDEKEFLPRLDSWDVRIMHSNAEADAVAAEGFEDLRKVFVHSSYSLDRGAIAFCIFSGRTLAHVGWLALTPEAKQHVDRLPYAVDFLGGQACSGGTYTVPRFRGKGLMAYGYYIRLEYLRQHGYTSSRNAVRVDNRASQRVHAKFDPEIRGTGRLIQVLRWRAWKETPFPEGPARRLPPAR
ncbi:MAG: hypothetical protein ACOC9B_05815 [Chloroflexota bacterium]